MPYVRGFLKVGRRGRPGRPDIGLPEEEGGPVDPDYGIEEGELPEIQPPTPPPGIWPPLTPEHPWRPLPGFPERPSTGPVPPGRPPGEVAPPIELPPGSIWPPLPPDVHGKYLALVLIGGMPGGPKYRYVVVDADAVVLPTPPAGGIGGTPPPRPTPGR